MDSNYIEKFYESIYFNELKRKEILYQRLQLPVGTVIILCGVVASYLGIFDPKSNSTLSILFFTLIILLAVCIIITVIFLAKAYHYTQVYGYIASPGEISKYADALKKYYKEEKGILDYNNKAIENDLSEYLIDEYIKYGDMNCKNNDKKAAYMYQANKFIIISLVVFCLSLIPFYITYYSKPKIQKVEVVNLNIKKGGDMNAGRKTNTDTAATTETDTATDTTAREVAKRRSNTQKGEYK